MFLGTRGGQFQLAPEGMLPSIRARMPIAVTDDFNADGHLDFAVFDAGVYVWAESNGYGNPPQLFLSTPSGQFLRSEALADGEQRRRDLHRRPRRPRHQAGAPQPAPDGSQYWGWDGGHLVDIDNDGDLDLALGHIRDRGPHVINQWTCTSATTRPLPTSTVTVRSTS